jgi:hypothetical protein
LPNFQTPEMVLQVLPCALLEPHAFHELRRPSHSWGSYHTASDGVCPATAGERCAAPAFLALLRPGGRRRSHAGGSSIRHIVGRRFDYLRAGPQLADGASGAVSIRRRALEALSHLLGSSGNMIAVIRS